MAYDVVIVGASIAGNTAALESARRGLKTLVVERSDPKDGYRIKPCGGGLSPITMEEFPQVKEFVVHVTKDIISKYEDIELVTKGFPVYMSNRDELDLGLADLAESEGAEYRYGESWKPGTYESEWLIGAGGVTCPVAKTFGHKRMRSPTKVAYFDDPNWNTREAVEIHYFPDLEGYGWIFPKGGFCDVGVGGNTKTLNRFYNRFLKICGYDQKQPLYEAGWSIPLDWNPSQEVIKDKTILVGDAGNFVNPLSGEGILSSMRSAKEAACIVAGELEADDYPTFGPHLTRLQKLRGEMNELGRDEFFQIGLENKQLFDEVIGCIYLEKEPPELIPKTDEEKTTIYSQMLANL